MIRRIFSRQTYNGYHRVMLKGDGENDCVGFFKKTDERDEDGQIMADVNDIPKCPPPQAGGFRPWGEWIIVPQACQKCKWVYQQPDSEFNCLLKSRANVKPTALVCGDE